MLNYEKVRSNAQQFLALTSLTVEEFDFLCNEFEEDWWRYYRYYTLRGRKRKVPLYKEHGNSSLPTTEMKLFFVLVYLKQYPLQQFQAANFGLSVGKTNEWIKMLLKTLKVTLERLKLQPCRDGELLKTVLEKMHIAIATLDACERKIQRSVDSHVQQEYYSGKTKDHTVKNNLLVTDTQEVVYLSQTYEGSVHDKKICDEENCQYPKGIEIRQDSGYQGHRPENVKITEPVKKPKGKELSLEQKQRNREISKLRVVVEHAISGIKRCRAVKEVSRNVGYSIKDLIMEVCCGLHNLRVRSPMRAYARTHVHARNMVFRL